MSSASGAGKTATAAINWTATSTWARPLRSRPPHPDLGQRRRHRRGWRSCVAVLGTRRRPAARRAPPRSSTTPTAGRPRHRRGRHRARPRHLATDLRPGQIAARIDPVSGRLITDRVTRVARAGIGVIVTVNEGRCERCVRALGAPPDTSAQDGRPHTGAATSRSTPAAPAPRPGRWPASASSPPPSCAGSGRRRDALLAARRRRRLPARPLRHRRRAPARMVELRRLDDEHRQHVAAAVAKTRRRVRRGDRQEESTGGRPATSCKGRSSTSTPRSRRRRRVLGHDDADERHRQRFAQTLTAGTYTAGGVSYGYRSALITASSSLSGPKSFTVAATDAAALPAASPDR